MQEIISASIERFATKGEDYVLHRIQFRFRPKFPPKLPNSWPKFRQWIALGPPPLSLCFYLFLFIFFALFLRNTLRTFPEHSAYIRRQVKRMLLAVERTSASFLWMFRDGAGFLMDLWSQTQRRIWGAPRIPWWIPDASRGSQKYLVNSDGTATFLPLVGREGGGGRRNQ